MVTLGLVADVIPFVVGIGFVVIIGISVLALSAEIPPLSTGVGFAAIVGEVPPISAIGVSAFSLVAVLILSPAGVFGGAFVLAIDMLSVMGLLDVGVTVTAVGTKALGFVAETLIVGGSCPLVVSTAAVVDWSVEIGATLVFEFVNDPDWTVVGVDTELDIVDAGMTTCRLSITEEIFA
jgi:hypothetical protein